MSRVYREAFDNAEKHPTEYEQGRDHAARLMHTGNGSVKDNPYAEYDKHRAWDFGWKEYMNEVYEAGDIS